MISTLRHLLAPLQRKHYPSATRPSRESTVSKAPAVQRSDWLLLALRESTNGLTPIQLQKVLFLLGERRRNAVGAKFYAFEAYNYGPFSREIYADAEKLAAEGLLVIGESAGRRLRRYCLTVTGADRAAELSQLAASNGVAYLAQVVVWVESLSFSALVRAVYDAYPEMRKNSVFQDANP